MTKQAQAGEVIEDRYRLERPLGAGGMGAVWLATQLMVDRPVAVKLLHPAFIDQQDLQRRFEVEAKAIGKLNHPNVVTLYDFGFSTELDAFYTVIEYIDGVSLDKRLNERMPLKEVCDIIRMVALALDHAHHHGILHRDLKPENVMLANLTDGSLVAKVLDFGIARIVKGTYEVESPESQRITKAGEVFGTPAYMSPEQARSIRRLTPASDLYALGIMFYELVAGRLPFFAKSAFDLLMLHVTKPVPPIQRNDVPPELIGIIYRLLDKDPENRFQSGAELARAIERVHLSDQPQSGDDFDQFPTIVNSKSRPTFPGSPPPMSLGNEETSPDSASFALPTPGHTPPSTEIRTSTVLLNGGQPPNHYSYGGRDHDTIPDTKERRYIALGVGAFILILSLIAAVGLLKASLDGPEEPTKDVTSENVKKILGTTTKEGDNYAGNDKKTPSDTNPEPTEDEAPEVQKPDDKTDEPDEPAKPAVSDDDKDEPTPKPDNKIKRADPKEKDEPVMPKFGTSD